MGVVFRVDGSYRRSSASPSTSSGQASAA